MLGLTFKESGASLDDIISALTVELEKLAAQPIERQASAGGVVGGKSSSRRRQGLPPNHQALTASRTEQSIAEAGRKRPQHRRHQRGGRRGKGRRPSQVASGSPGQVAADAEASAAIEALTANLAGACQAAGFEVTGSSESAGSGEALSRAV